MSESQITDPDQQRILWECLMQQRELDAVEEPPLEQFWEKELLEHQRQHGPTYRFRNWFEETSARNNEQLIRGGAIDRCASVPAN